MPRRHASGTALAFWAGRLRRAGLEVAREGDHLRFDDPEGLGFELRAVETRDAPLVARHPEIPADVALRGFDGVRAYSVEPERSRTFLEASLGFAAAGSGDGAPMVSTRSSRSRAVATVARLRQ